MKTRFRIIEMRFMRKLNVWTHHCANSSVGKTHDAFSTLTSTAPVVPYHFLIFFFSIKIKKNDSNIRKNFYIK